MARAMNTRDPIPASALPGSATREGALAPPSERRRGALHALIATIRPKQWTKNALVFAAAGAAGALGDDEVPPRVAIAFVAFCLLASGIYAINDVRDATEDRLHPRKRHRPVAAGELEPRTAVALGIGLMVAGLALCAALSPLLAVVGAGYLALTLSYTMVWRYIALLDVGAIAGGFVLRAVAGGVAAPVTLSRWFVLVISCAALFVAGGKRHSELRRTAADGSSRREVLEHYGEPLVAADRDRQRRVRGVRLLRLGFAAPGHRRDPVAAADDHSVRGLPPPLRHAAARGGGRGPRGAPAAGSMAALAHRHLARAVRIRRP